MTYRPIEQIDEKHALVQDDDGFTILTIDGPHTVPMRVWLRAHSEGAAMLVFGRTHAISVEDFEQHRTEVPSTASYDVTNLREMTPDPAYRDYLVEQVATEEVDRLAVSEFVHLHTHTEYSQLDGLSTWEEVFTTIQADPKGGGAVASADHGNCAGHPEQQDLADKYGVKPIFGMEAYFVPDRHRRSRSWIEFEGFEVDPANLTDADRKKTEKKNDSVEVKAEYTHITLWARDQVGLRNLWAMSTEAYREGLYDGKPRLDWDTLERFSEGVICGTGCLRGPVARPLIEDDVDTAREALMRLRSIFDDRLYIEMHTNQLDDQIKVNKTLYQFCADYGIEPLAAVDSHYSVPEHKDTHQTWVAMQIGKTLAEDTSMFQGRQDYHLKTADEVRASLAYFPSEFVERSMANTVEIARQCTAKVGGEVTTPTYSKASDQHPDPVQRDIERLVEICLANWERKTTGKRYDQATYMARFEREMKLLVEKGFCGYFLIVWDYVAWAKSQGCLVGPGRGSGGGSLVAYLADIVEIDPVDSDLIFERFLTEGRKSLPDFDIDFPTSWRQRILNYLISRWGVDFVSNIGTVGRLRTKQAINDVVRVMKPVLPYEVDFKDFENLKKEVTAADRPLAGKHLPWDEFQAQYADTVDPMRRSYPEIFEVVDIVMDRVKVYGKHAAGVVISTDSPLTDLPMRLVVDKDTKEEIMVTQFDMVALEILGYVKFDILTLRTLDTLQICIDLISETFGHRVNPYDWKEEHSDPQVWAEVSDGRTLGLFQIETASGTRLTRRMQPGDLYDLAAVMTVVRPGPMRSGLTESYLRRRAGIEEVTYLDPRLEDFLGDTYGSMIYQEQVMAVCMNLAGYDSTEADTVRKLLGKKQVVRLALTCLVSGDRLRHRPHHRRATLGPDGRVRQVRLQQGPRLRLRRARLLVRLPALPLPPGVPGGRPEHRGRRPDPRVHRGRPAQRLQDPAARREPLQAAVLQRGHRDHLRALRDQGHRHGRRRADRGHGALLLARRLHRALREVLRLGRQHGRRRHAGQRRGDGLDRAQPPGRRAAVGAGQVRGVQALRLQGRPPGGDPPPRPAVHLRLGQRAGPADAHQGPGQGQGQGAQGAAEEVHRGVPPVHQARAHPCRLADALQPRGDHVARARVAGRLDHPQPLRFHPPRRARRPDGPDGRGDGDGSVRGRGHDGGGPRRGGQEAPRPQRQRVRLRQDEHAGRGDRGHLLRQRLR